ncbi:MAG: hypothetical protein ABIO70_28085 [Pseudomonadota bacterium]
MWLRGSAERAGWSPQEVERALSAPGRPLPRLDFVPAITSCPICDNPLFVHKTHIRTVTTLSLGTFEAREFQLRCDRNEPARREGCPTVNSEELARLVPPGQGFGYDLMVHAGLSRYLEGKQRKEIWLDLRRRGIKLAEGSVTNLCDRFISHLEALHLLRAPYLRAAMSRGWALHLDATCHAGKGGLFVCMDGISGWVLQAARIDSESEEALTPTVERTVALFGDPIATVRDLGKGMAGAVSGLRERGIPDLACHYHFLRAVGTKLLQEPYDRLRRLLKTYGVASRLTALRRELRPYVEGMGPEGVFGPGRVRENLLAFVHWLGEGGDGKNARFPFAMPHLELVLRCQGASQVAASWVPRPWNRVERRVMERLDRLTTRLDKDSSLGSTIAELQQRWGVFTELRSVLRLSDSELPGGSHRDRQVPLAAAEWVRLTEIQLAVRQYEADLRQRAGAEVRKKRPSAPEAIVLKYLDRYHGHLFGHPAIRDEDGQILAVVERTNNPPEHLFGEEKQRLRRRIGRANLAHDLQQQPAQVALVTNLRHSDYVRLLCGSIENLPAAFASLDRADVAGIRLIRDHRDSRLDRLVRRLSDHSPPPDDTRLHASSI